MPWTKFFGQVEWTPVSNFEIMKAQLNNPRVVVEGHHSIVEHDLHIGKGVHVPRIYKQTSKVAIKSLTVDDEDIDLSRWCWRLNKYAYRGPVGQPGNKRTIWLHREVMERKLGRPLRLGECVDHRDGNKLNNHRSNLRVATTQQNMMNRVKRVDGVTSSYIGVSSVKKRAQLLWTAAIGYDGKQLIIGRYKNELDAAWMRDQWTLALYGEFGILNFEYVPVEAQS